MKEAGARAQCGLPLPLARQLDELCCRFEAVWKAGQRPRIEDYLAGLAEPVMACALPELVTLDIAYRRRAGESPQAEDYSGRFPCLDKDRLASLIAPPPSGEARTLGDFRILREIGRGGMGVVYEAQQVSLNRKVALKVLNAGLGLTPRAVRRFHREAEAAAKLHHTNIVPVYATGQENDTHFYAMELIEGPSLDRVIKQLRASAGGQPSDESSSTNSPPPPGGMAATGPYVELSRPRVSQWDA